jgi:hypothetical protein
MKDVILHGFMLQIIYTTVFLVKQSNHKQIKGKACIHVTNITQAIDFYMRIIIALGFIICLHFFKSYVSCIIVRGGHNGC